MPAHHPTALSWSHERAVATGSPLKVSTRGPQFARSRRRIVRPRKMAPPCGCMESRLTVDGSWLMVCRYVEQCPRGKLAGPGRRRSRHTVIRGSFFRRPALPFPAPSRTAATKLEPIRCESSAPIPHKENLEYMVEPKALAYGARSRPGVAAGSPSKRTL